MAWKNKDTGKELTDIKEAIVEEPKKKNVVQKEAVVNELPQIQTRTIQGEDGVVYNLMTTNEAIQKILEGVEELIRRTDDE